MWKKSCFSYMFNNFWYLLRKKCQGKINFFWRWTKNVRKICYEVLPSCVCKNGFSKLFQIGLWPFLVVELSQRTLFLWASNAEAFHGSPVPRCQNAHQTESWVEHTTSFPSLKFMNWCVLSKSLSTLFTKIVRWCQILCIVVFFQSARWFQDPVFHSEKQKKNILNHPRGLLKTFFFLLIWSEKQNHFREFWVYQSERKQVHVGRYSRGCCKLT